MAYTEKDVERVLQKRRETGGQRKTFETGKERAGKQGGMTAEDVEKVLQRRKTTGQERKTFDAEELTVRTGSPEPGTVGKIDKRGLVPAMDALRQGNVFGAVVEAGKAIGRDKEQELLSGTPEELRKKQQKKRKREQLQEGPGNLSAQLYPRGGDVYARVNAWRDADPRNRALEKAVRYGKLGEREKEKFTSYAERGTSLSASETPLAGGYAQTGHSKEARPYTDSELQEMGYSPEEIATARRMIRDYDELTLMQKAGRRVLHSAAGVADQLAGGVAMTAGALPSAAADLAGVETKGTSRTEKLKAAIRRVDGTNGAYTDEDLAKQGGWSLAEIRAARAEMEREGESPDNPLYNWGKEQHQRGREFTADAMAGESETGRFWHGAATSAAENLALAAIKPAAVLPVLTAQTVGDSLAESDERGEGAGKALLRAAAKGAVGYGVEQLGVEQMLAGMGKTGAGGWAAALVDRMGRNPVAQKAPELWNVLAGAGEEAGEEFAETYADALVDAILDGDTGKMIRPELLGEALAAAAGGAAGGALIGAGATGYRKAQQAGQARAEAQAEAARQEEARRAALAEAQAEAKEEQTEAAQTLEAARDMAKNQAATAAQKAQRGPYRGEAEEDIWEEEPPEAASAAALGAEEVSRQENDGQNQAETAETQAETQGAAERTPEERSQSGGVETKPVRAEAREMTEGEALATAEETAPAESLTGPERKARARERAQATQELAQRRISPEAVKIIGEQTPAGVSGESWANAAATVYRLGKSGETETFDRAVKLAEGSRGLGVDTASVLAQGKQGRTALQLAWAQGRGEYEAGAKMQDGGKLGGPVTAQSFAAKGKVRNEGSLRMDSEAATQLIALNAAATGTDAVLRNSMMTPTGTRSARANAAINTETGKIFFGDEAQDVLGSVLHEDLHWYNSFDEEGGRAFQRSILGALAAEYGQEDVESLRAEYRRRYFNLSESQVEEEMAADAVRGLFTEPEHLRQWVQVQRKEAEKNEEKRGIIRKVMDSVRGMLDNIVAKAKELLRIDPENRAALRAKGMAEEQKEILRAEYYQHMEKAMEKRRAAAQQSGAALEEGQKAQALRLEMVEKAAQEARGNIQRQASRSIMDEEGSGLDILAQALGLSRGVRVLDVTLDKMAGDHIRKAKSRASRQSVTAQLRAAVEYLRAEGADMAKGQAVVEQIAENILRETGEMDRELWEQYPQLHQLEYTVAKDGPAKADLVRRWGSWKEAVAEAKRHGVRLRQAENYRDRNPAEHLESILQDERGADEAEIFRAAAQKAGVAGAESLEASEWLEVLMNVRDSIRPVMRSRYQDEAEFEDAVMMETVSLLQDILKMPEVSKVEMLVEANQKAIRQAAEEGAKAAGADEKTAGRIGREAAKRAEGPMRETQKLRHTLAAQEKKRAAQQDELEQWMRTTQEILKMHEVEPAKSVAAMQKQLVELYEKEAKRQQRTLEKIRQEMLDEAELEFNQEKARLEWEVESERRRADRAEYQLIIQEDEILEWEEENQKRKEEWERKQAERDAQAMELAQQMEGDEGKMALLAEKRVERARDGRRREELRRSIRHSASQLNQMLLRPKEGSYVQEQLLPQAIQVAQLADAVTRNKDAVSKLNTLRRGLAEAAAQREIDTGSEGQNELEALVDRLAGSLENNRNKQLEKQYKQLAKAEALGDSQKAEELRARIKGRIRELESQDLPLRISTEELGMLDTAVKGTLHTIRTANRTLSQEKSQKIGEFAEQAAVEVRQSQGNGLYGLTEEDLKSKTKGAERKARGMELAEALRTLSPGRLLAMVGGYQQGGRMDQLGEMLQRGQDRQHEIIVGGEKMFAPLTQDKEGTHGFAGKGAELVDIGLKDSKGKAVPLNHAQLCSLKMHLQNKDSLNHLMNGGFVVPDPGLYQAGEVAAAYQNGRTVSLLKMGEFDLPAAVDKALSEYDKEWIKTMREFFDHYTTDIINETSLKLVGYKKAEVKNYYPISVDSGTLARDIEGLKHDGTIAGRGFLKERQQSKKPLLLEECQEVVQRSLRDAADYGGMALPIRDVQRVLNATVETEDGPVILKSKVIEEKWGRETVEAIDKVLTDLQARPKGERDPILQANGTIRGNYAQAVLGMNLGVVLSQVSGAAANGAVLDGEASMKTMVQFVRNLRPKEQQALRQEMREHGDSEMEWRMLGNDGETLADVAGKRTRIRDLYPMAIQAAHLPSGMTRMDEATVSAAWAGAKAYIKKHPGEFELEEKDIRTQSEDYWEAVRGLFRRAMQSTQPSAGVMQQGARMRSKDGLLVSLNMFQGQSYQNKGLMLDAFGEYFAARRRWGGKTNPEAVKRMQQAEEKMKRAVASQVVSAVLFALSRFLRDMILRREELWQNENGDITAWSFGKNLALHMAGTLAGGLLFGQGFYNAAEYVLTNARYSLFEVTGMDAIDDLLGAFGEFNRQMSKPAEDRTPEEMEGRRNAIMSTLGDLVKAGGTLVGIPIANVANLFAALEKWAEKGFNFRSLPKSPAGQYDRLYTAYEEKDEAEAAALEKLEAMGKAENVIPEMKKRLKAKDEAVADAARDRLAGKSEAVARTEAQIVKELCEVLDIPKGDKEQRTAVAEAVSWAVEELVDQELAGSEDGSPYDALSQAVQSGKGQAAQNEIRRLLRAGKEKTAVKQRITAAVRPLYKEADERQRQRLNQMLLALKDDEERPLYKAKEILGWLK